jgi:hypothetical protein
MSIFEKIAGCLEQVCDDIVPFLGTWHILCLHSLVLGFVAAVIFVAPGFKPSCSREIKDVSPKQVQLTEV